MTDSRYKRVSRMRPCLICGKPDWCSRTADDSISFCARMSQGADRLSRKEQWGVFYHDTELLHQTKLNQREPPKFNKQSNPEIKAAPLEIRDFVYKTLLRLSPAHNFQSLTEGSKGLFDRGLYNTEDYGALPRLAAERHSLAEQIRVLFNHNFPDFVRQNPHGISHVPGFWISDSGNARLWSDKDFHYPILLIPYRNPWDKIQACQLRFFGTDFHYPNRYMWLSLPSRRSAGSGTPLHFANWRSFGSPGLNLPVLVTEGALKADVVVNFYPQYIIIANSGVGCSHETIALTTSGKKIFLAFDNDYSKNPAVIRQFAKLIFTVLKNDSFQLGQDKVTILSWNQNFKGIDDALLNNHQINEVCFSDWLSQLSIENREIFLQVFRSQNFN